MVSKISGRNAEMFKFCFIGEDEGRYFMIVGGDVPDAPFDAFVSFSTVTLTESLCLRGVEVAQRREGLE